MSQMPCLSVANIHLSDVITDITNWVKNLQTKLNDQNIKYKIKLYELAIK